MKRKPRLAASMTARSALREVDTGALQEKGRKLNPNSEWGKLSDSDRIKYREKEISPGKGE
jgi:hypothetical protein